MNNRIRQFEVESHIDVYALGKDCAKWEAVLEKFAELVVRECADIADTAEPFLSSDLIKQHFGVEQ